MSNLSLIIGGNSSGAQKAIEDVSLRLKDQRAILKQLQTDYANLDTTAARGKAGKLIADDIKIANAEIKRLSTVSTNSFGDIGKGATKAFSAVRSLAYVLPGIGIAGIFSLAAEGVTTLVTSLIGQGGATDAFHQLLDIVSKAKDKFSDAYTQVETLRTNINLAKQGFISKTEVVKEYNETLGKTTGFVNSLAEAEARLGENADAYIEFTLKKAIAQIAAGKAAELAFKRAELELNTPREAKGLGLLGSTPNKGTAEQRSNQAYQNAITRIYQRQNDELTKQENLLQSISQNAQKDAAILAQRFGFKSFNGSFEKPKPAGSLKSSGLIDGNTNIRDFESIKKIGLQIQNFRAKLLEDEKKLNEEADKSRDEYDQEQAKKQKQKAEEQRKYYEELNKSRIESFKQQMEQVKKIGLAIGDALSNSFNSFFEAMINGKNPIKALGQSIKQLAIQIIEAAVKAFILKKVLSLLGGGGSPFGQFGFQLPGFAAGGRPPTNRPSIIGENGPELFIPDTAGRIIPNNALSSYAGSAAQMISGNVVVRMAGRDLVGVLALENAYQRRNG